MFKKLKIKNNKKLISQNLKSIFLLLFLILKRKISKYIQTKINISLKFLINNYEPNRLLKDINHKQIRWIENFRSAIKHNT